MSRFLNPFPQFLKLQDGVLQPNTDGYLTFYVNNSSTLASVYTNVGLTIAASNPQQLDANGRMTQNVFLTTDVYRVKLTDSAGAVIWDKNDFSVADSTDIEALIQQLEDLIASATAELFATNFVQNPGMSVDNADTAGSPVSLTTAYQDTVSGFASSVLSNVSAGTALQSATKIGESGYSLKYNGVSCTSAGQPALRFRISGNDTTSLSNGNITISLVVKHDVGSAVNYTISTYTANAFNNFAAVTTTGISSTTSVASGTATTISVTSAFGDISNGLEVIVKAVPNQSLTTKNFYWSDVGVYQSSSVLPFRVPMHREEQYAVLDPTTLLTAATQAQMEAASSNAVAVTPANAKYAPSASKAWVRFAGRGTNGACTIAASYNVSGVSRTAAGRYAITFTNAFSSSDYAVAAIPQFNAFCSLIIDNANPPTTTVLTLFMFNNGTGTGDDPNYISATCYGDQ